MSSIFQPTDETNKYSALTVQAFTFQVLSLSVEKKNITIWLQAASKIFLGLLTGRIFVKIFATIEIDQLAAMSRIFV